MDCIEFKVPDEVGKIPNVEYFISYILNDENGFKIAFYQDPDDVYQIVFDFGYAVVDYRVTDEGRRFDHHYEKISDQCKNKISKHWFLLEIKDSEYLKKIYEESCGIYEAFKLDLKHYITGDVDYLVDIISDEEPKVYKAKKVTREFEKIKT